MVETDKEGLKNNPDEISLKDLILKIKEWKEFLLSKWVTIIIAAAIGCVFGIAYAWIKPPIYKAELSFALEDDKSSGGGFGAAMGLANQFGIDLGSNGGGAFSGDNLLELMTSRSMVEKTLLSKTTINNKEQTLVELYISFNKFRKKWNKSELRNINFLVSSDRTLFNLQQDSILGVFYNKIIKDNLTVDKIDKKLSIVNIRVNSENEMFAKYFTELLAKTVSDFYVTTKTKKSVENVDILQRQTDSVRRELNTAITGVASSVDVNPNANPALQILRVPSQRRQVDVQANTAILNQLVANLELAKVSLRKETPLIQVIDKPILPLPKEKLSRLITGILGGILVGFFTMVFLIIKKLYNNIMS
jgi:uncharacterized protein involved in exopolysaccharide biosynthesis